LLGSGGAMSSKYEKMTDEDFYQNRIKRMQILIKEDPIKNKMQKSFTRLSKKRDDILAKSLEKYSDNDAKIKKQELKVKDDELIRKSVSNLRTLRGLLKAERDKRQLEDLLLSTGLRTDEQNTSNLNIPKVYSLSQNYPNPFNPVTKINYELPKDGMIKLVIYDILGREIKTLVNEIKQTGRYTVEFNGSGFASGVYFYRIQAGSFVQVKRMVLIK
jgi:hypothetical protein